MTNNKNLEILVGDDAFKEIFVDQIFNNTYIPELKKGLSEYEVNVTTDIDYKEVIQNASKYDVVVTDLDYTGYGKGKEGYEVVDAISKMNPKPLIIMCTSSDEYQEIEEKTAGKINYLAGAGEGHKFDDLLRILIKHYQN